MRYKSDIKILNHLRAFALTRLCKPSYTGSDEACIYMCISLVAAAAAVTNVKSSCRSLNVAVDIAHLTY